MAARSVKCTVRNESKQHNLALYEAIIDHGTWSAEWSPPDHIPFGTERTWGSESDGFLTGTEGHATYWVGDTGAQVVFYFDNPFAGSNTFTQKLLVPAANGGPGVPDYEPFDPMQPDDPQSRFKQTEDQAPQFAHGSDPKVVYCFRQHEAPAADAPPPPAATTTAVSATPDAQTTVMCSPGFRKVVFIGCTYFSSLAESKQLQKQVSDLTIVTPDPSAGKSLMTDADFIKDTPLLDKVRDRLTALENADDPVQTTLFTKPPPVPVGNAPRILMIRALAKMLANVDADLNPGADCLALKRLVISGHHCGAWTNNREDVIWGSDSLGSPPHQILTLFNDGGNHGVLAGLAEIFPKAFLQVEDLCFSACLTGYLSSPIPPKIFAMFKNLQTLWAYENESPNAANPTPGQAFKLSSNRAICDWEIASRTAGSGDALDKASRELRASFKGNKDVGKSIIWVKGSPRTVND